MRWFAAMLLAAGVLLVSAFAWLGIPATGAGLAAKNLCSGVFVAGRRPADVLSQDVLPASTLLRLVDVSVDAERQL
ncbi:MAG TPA: serine hydrolase, partial [Lautropia sp.]|nr:serine hydrolase [Lautropia sp.]